MTGYWAHYTTRIKHADGSRGTGWTETFPVVGYTDVALVIDSDGNARTVHALREELAEGDTHTVTLEVDAHDGEE